MSAVDRWIDRGESGLSDLVSALPVDRKLRLAVTVDAALGFDLTASLREAHPPEPPSVGERREILREAVDEAVRARLGVKREGYCRKERHHSTTWVNLQGASEYAYGSWMPRLDGGRLASAHGRRCVCPRCRPPEE